MKNKLTTIIITILTMVLTGIAADAQPNPNRNDWKERMQSGKIAFLTMEIGLTPEEAQNFWPIYNSVNKELDEATYNTVASYMELEKALNDKKSDKEVSKYLNKYLEAMGSQNRIRTESVEKYKKILPDSKVAKIFVAEEKFRRQHIRMLQYTPATPTRP